MAAPRESQPRTRRYSLRYQARLDAETSAKLQELAAAFHRKHSAILRYVMQWGLAQARGWTIDQSLPAIVQTVGMLLEPELLQQVQEAAAAHGTTVAAWVRHACGRSRSRTFRPAGAPRRPPADRMIRARIIGGSCCA
jgi:predicted DNA-binding protein